MVIAKQMFRKQKMSMSEASPCASILSTNLEHSN